MPRSYKAPNKRIIPRSSGGQFRKTTALDFGIGGICQNCNHFLLRHYDGDTRAEFLDPRKWVYRCFTCNPLTEAEQTLKAEIEASKPKPRGLGDVLREIAEREGLTSQ